MSAYIDMLKQERIELGYKLKDLEKKNARYKNLALKISRYEELDTQLANFIQINKNLLHMALIEYKTYKEHRLDEISQYIEGSCFLNGSIKCILCIVRQRCSGT